MEKVTAILLENEEKKNRFVEQKYVNLLRDADVQITADSGEVSVENAYEKKFSLDCLSMLTDGEPTKHVDIHCKEYTLLFDMKSEKYIDFFSFATFFCDSGNMGVDEFTVWCGTDPEDLQEIIHYDNRGRYKKGRRNSSDWKYKIGAKIRYLKIRIISADSISRLNQISLFNNEINEQHTYICEKFGKDELENKTVVAEGITKGTADALTNGVVFCDSCAEFANGGSVTAEIKNTAKITKLYVIGVGEGKLQIDVAGQITVCERLEAPHSRTLFVADVKAINHGNIKINFCGKWVIDEIFAISELREVEIDPSRVLCDNFLGVGANVVPTSFMPEAMELGFNDVYWQLEKRRMQICKPHVARVWFQVDWIVDNEIDYICGKYDFNSVQMQSVCKYIEALEEVGCDVDLNFGWKAGTKIQEWFAMEGVRPEKRLNSAPNDLLHFGIACAETLKEFIVNRGYDNVKYLSLYNEPDYGQCESQSGDFVVPDASYRYPYWRDMMLEVYKAAKDNGTLGKFMFWGYEGFADKTWITNLNKDCKFLDMHTVHRYTLNYDEAVASYSDYKRLAEDKNISLTEFGTFGRNGLTDNCNHIENVIAAANCGYSSTLIWILNGEFLVDPLSWAHAGGNDGMDNSFSFWNLLCIDGCINDVGESYYELATFMNYVPKGSKTISAKMESCNDCRAAAFKTDNGDYTVVVECESRLKQHKLRVKFAESINRKFYKYVYYRHLKSEGNLIIPTCVGEIDVNNEICDTLDTRYNAITYSTLPPVPQVVLNAVEFKAKPGETVSITAKVLDGDGKITWDIAEAVGTAGTLNGGEYTVAKDSKPGDMVAIRATLNNDSTLYAIAIVKTI